MGAGCVVVFDVPDQAEDAVGGEDSVEFVEGGEGGEVVECLGMGEGGVSFVVLVGYCCSCGEGAREVVSFYMC